MLKNYVINVATNTERQAHIQQEFGKKNIPFTFFKAVTPIDTDSVYQQLGLTADTSHCTAGEMACLLSHVSLWQRCLDENLDYIGIFEDDIILGESSQKLLTQIDWLKNHQMDFVKLEKTSRRAYLAKPSEFLYSTTHRVYELRSRHINAAGYILSKVGATQLLTFVRGLSQLEAIDILLFDVKKYPKNIITYQVLPAIVIQAKKIATTANQALISSDLREGRGTEIKEEKTSLERLSNEIQRWAKPLYMTNITFR